MQKLVAASLPANLGVASAAGGFVLLASLVNLLRYNGYRLTAPEVLWVAAGLVAVAVVLGALYLLAGRPTRAIADGLLVMLAIDLNFESSAVAIAAGVAVMAVAWWRNRSLAPIIAFMAGVVLAANLGMAALDRPKAEPPVARGADPKLPVLLHLILDEHIGADGLPARNPRSAAVREAMIDGYVGEGFWLYGRAYSEHFHTINAIPQIMNLGETQAQVDGKAERGVRLSRNRYLDHLEQRGYAVNIYQNDWIDLCQGRKARCVRYAAGGLRGVEAADLSTKDKAALIALNLLSLSKIAEHVSMVYDVGAFFIGKLGVGAPPMIQAEQRRLTNALTSLAVADGLIAELKQARGGEAYIAHLLLPHYPYVTGPDCAVRPRAQWGYRRSRAPMEQRQDAYFDQLGCAATLVGRAVTALEQSPAGPNVIVVIHGDHGSRITREDPRADRTVADEDMIAGHSTLFAVRAPAIAPGYEPRPEAVPALLKALVETDFTTAPIPAGSGAVMLEDDGWAPRKAAALPAGWRAR